MSSSVDDDSYQVRDANRQRCRRRQNVLSLSRDPLGSAYQTRLRLAGGGYPLLRKTDALMPSRLRATAKNRPRRRNHRQHNLLPESVGLM